MITVTPKYEKRLGLKVGLALLENKECTRKIERHAKLNDMELILGDGSVHQHTRLL